MSFGKLNGLTAILAVLPTGDRGFSVVVQEPNNK